MALSIKINITDLRLSSIPINTKVADIVASGGTEPYTYSLASGDELFQINGTTVVTKAVVTLDNIIPFSVTVTDSTSASATSDSYYPSMQAAIQYRFSQTNYTYKITKDIDLGHGILTIPAGCTLDFQGGLFSNGELVGNNTKIKSGLQKIFDNLIIKGVWGIDNAYPEWFGASSTNSDSTLAIQNTLNSFSKTVLTGGPYIITSTIIVPEGHFLEGNVKSGIISKISTGYSIIANTGVTISKLTLTYYSLTTFSESIVYTNVGIKLKGGLILLDRVNVANFSLGVETNSFLTTIDSVYCKDCGTGFYIHGIDDSFPTDNENVGNQNTSIFMKDCYSENCRWYGYYIQNIVYSTFINCAADKCGMSSVAKVTNLYYAYKLLNCSSSNFLNPAAELCAQFILIMASSKVSILNPVAVLGFSFSGQDTKNISNIIANYGSYNIILTNPHLDIVNSFSYVEDRIVVLDGYQASNVIKCFYITLSPSGILKSIDNIFSNNDPLFNKIDVASPIFTKGETIDRPILSQKSIGFTYYDSTLGKLILWNGAAWINVDGTPLT